MPMAKQRPVTMKEQLRAVGLRATKPRLALAALLEHRHQPVGTPDLSAELVPKQFDLATLYRTLKSFQDAGLVRHVPLDQRFASYEWVQDADEHHHHLVCRDCGLIEEIPECDLEALEKRVLKASKRFDSVTSHSLEFFGVCSACAG